jgi:hypothetical protein
MKRIAVFTEGQTELVFVRNLVGVIHGYENICFTCMNLHAESLREVPYKHTCPNPKVEYLIVNVAGDSKVLSAITEREEKLIDEGYDEVIGLRDMYCEEYVNSSSTIDPNLNQSFISNHHETINTLANADKIRFFFAIMEIESWILAMYTLLEKYNPALTKEYIIQCLNIDLENIDPEEVFFHPTLTMMDIFAITGDNYDKSKDVSEAIFHNLTTDDLGVGTEGARCECLSLFLECLRSHRGLPFGCSVQ